MIVGPVRGNRKKKKPTKGQTYKLAAELEDDNVALAAYAAEMEQALKNIDIICDGVTFEMKGLIVPAAEPLHDAISSIKAQAARFVPQEKEQGPPETLGPGPPGQSEDHTDHPA